MLDLLPWFLIIGWGLYKSHLYFTKVRRRTEGTMFGTIFLGLLGTAGHLKHEDEIRELRSKISNMKFNMDRMQKNQEKDYPFMKKE